MNKKEITISLEKNLPIDGERFDRIKFSYTEVISIADGETVTDEQIGKRAEEINTILNRSITGDPEWICEKSFLADKKGGGKE